MHLIWVGPHISKHLVAWALEACIMGRVAKFITSTCSGWQAPKSVINPVMGEISAAGSALSV